MPERQTQPHYSMADAASCEKPWELYPIIHFIILTHHQLAEHNEHARSRHQQPQRAGGRLHRKMGWILTISTERAVNVVQWILHDMQCMDKNCIICSFICYHSIAYRTKSVATAFVYFRSHGYETPGMFYIHIYILCFSYRWPRVKGHVNFVNLGDKTKGFRKSHLPPFLDHPRAQIIHIWNAIWNIQSCHLFYIKSIHNGVIYEVLITFIWCSVVAQTILKLP